MRNANEHATIIVKSTVPIGFIEELREELGCQTIYFSPEFLREGRALHDNLYPSRIIVGGRSEACRKFANMLAECSATPDCPCILMGEKEAEAVKLFANTYLAMRVGYFNELDSFCMTHGLSTGEVINGVCLEPRIGEGYNNPSFGYGGYCFPKDTKQMVANPRQHSAGTHFSSCCHKHGTVGLFGGSDSESGAKNGRGLSPQYENGVG